LPEDEMTTVRGIPVTGVSRALFDMAGVVLFHQLERAMHEVEVQRLTDCISLHKLVVRYPRRPGIPAVKRLLEAGAQPTRSEFEALALAFIRAYGFRVPETNILVEGFECDLVWREERVIVELDGRTIHDTAAAFEQDRARDRVLQANGWRVIRITWRQLQADADELAADLRTILRARPRRRRGRARGEDL
jgi:very-short-patch-repair endonuclease